VTTPGGSPSTTVGRLIRILASTGFTPSIPTGTYTVLTNSSNVITFTVPASTTHAAGANVSFSPLETSAIYADYIFSNSLTTPVLPGFNITSLTVTIAQTSTTAVSLSPATATVGSYMLFVKDQVAGGATGTFSMSKAIAANNPDDGLKTMSKGTNNQRVKAIWPSSSTIQLQHQPAFAGGSGNYVYNVTIVYAANY
jgi:hypothetical protein